MCILFLTILGSSEVEAKGRKGNQFSQADDFTTDLLPSLLHSTVAGLGNQKTCLQVTLDGHSILINFGSFFSPVAKDKPHRTAPFFLTHVF